MAEHEMEVSSGARIWRWIGIALLVLMIGWVFWRMQGNSDPMAGIPMPPPPPPLPSPNAHDAYLKAATACSSLSKLKAEKAIGYPNDFGKYTLAEKEAVLAAGSLIDLLLRQGFAAQYQDPNWRVPDQGHSGYASFRQLARYLLFKSRVEAQRGAWGASMNTSIDGLRLGSDIEQHAPCIGMLVGIAIEAIERREVWNTVDHLNGKEASSAAARMEKIAAGAPAFADMLQEEKYGMQLMLLQIFKQPSWRALYASLSDGGESKRGVKLTTYLKSKRAVMAEYTGHMDAMIALARKPYAQCRTLQPPGSQDSPLLPVFDKAREKYLVNQVQNRLLLLKLALRAYAAEHGNYPSTLSALSPVYLKKLPDDPFAAGCTFQYRLKGKTCLLYSVGPDGADNAGTPIFDPSKAGDMRYWIFGDSNRTNTGDIVAGVNTM